MFNKLSSFVLNPEKSKGLGQVYVAQPDMRLQKLAGKVFILSEFSDKKKDGENIFNFLISNLEQNYYEDEKVLLREKIEDLKVENLFEAAITKTNRDFNIFLSENKIKLKSGNDNITIGLIFEDKLYFSSYGKNRALLIYKQKEDFEMINVETNAFDDHDSNNKKSSIHKLPKIFSSVISGEIPKNAYFLFTSESLPEYISEKEITNILSKLPPLAAASQIKNILEQINNFVPFFGLIIKSATELDMGEIEAEDEIRNAHKSISSLNHTEQKTEAMLASKGFLNFKKLKNWIKDIKQEKREKEQKLENQKDIKRKVKEETNNTSENKQHKEPKIDIIRTMSSIKKDKNLLKDKFSFKKTVNKLFTQISKTASTFPFPGKRFFNNLAHFISRKFSKKNTALIGFSLILIVIVLSVSVIATNKKNRIKVLDEKFITISLEIDDMQTSIESDLLYNNYKKASETLDEMRETINAFPQENDEEKAYYQELITKIETNQETIYKINRLNESSLIADFKDTNIENISSFNNNIFALTNNSYYKLDSDKENNIIEDEFTSLDNDYTSYDPQFDTENNNLYFLSNENLAKLNLENNNIETFNTSDINLNKDVVAFETFLNRDKLYLLNPVANQIHASDKGTNGTNYPQTSTWLNNDLNISNAIDIIIDGDIYILFKNGNIEKYRSGEKQEYPQIEIKPSSNNFSKMLEKDGYFYIFNESEKKIVIIKKEDGSLMSQYIFNDLSNPSDFSLGNGGDIFVLDNNKIYKYSI